MGINVKNNKVKIENISINKSVPFRLNVYRILSLILISILLYSLKNDEFWKKPYSPKNFKQVLMFVLIIDIGILFTFFINQNCLDKKAEDSYSKNLVESLSKGEVYLSDVPDTSKLEELENPYDSIERGKLERDKDYIWDFAYYEGKYYSYFGVVPALLLMVPYHLITKKLLSTGLVTLIFSLLSIPVISILTKKVIQKYFKDIPFKFMFFSVLIMIFGTNLIFVNVAPRFYELVTVAGFFFVVDQQHFLQV